jgi:hypothetical protein
MKKGVFALIMLLGCCAVFSGCVKTAPAVFTINPSMSATIGTYNFVAAKTVPSTIRFQHADIDTGTTLVITGYTSDPVSPYDKIVISVTKYTGITNTYSIVQGQASATYYHGNTVSPAAGGIVSIQKVTTTTISGYFSFNTIDNIAVTNGLFNVGLP